MKRNAISLILLILGMLVLANCGDSATGGSSDPVYCKIDGNCYFEIGTGGIDAGGMSPKDCLDAGGAFATAEACGIALPSSSSSAPAGGNWCVSHDYQECILLSELTAMGYNCVAVGGVVMSSCPPGYDYDIEDDEPSSSSSAPANGNWCVEHDWQECILVSDLASIGYTCAEVGGAVQSSCPPGYYNYSEDNVPPSGNWCVDNRYEDCILVSYLAQCGDTCATFEGTVQSSCPYSDIWSFDEWCD